MLTPHEAARIQFFPDFFDFGVDSTRTEYCRAIGNAVPPKMGFVVAMALLMAEAATS
jgi:DNA (cytosine-5)-methyltransferase 1